MFTDQPQCPATSKFSLPTVQNNMIRRYSFKTSYQHFFFFFILVFISLKVSELPQGHMSLSSPLVKRVYMSAAGSDHVNIWTLNINCDLYPLGKITEPNGLAD